MKKALLTLLFCSLAACADDTTAPSTRREIQAPHASYNYVMSAVGYEQYTYGTSYIYAKAISPLGRYVVGYTDVGGGYARAFIIDRTTHSLDLLPLLPGSVNSEARAVNDDGWVVGESTSTTPYFSSSAVVWRPGEAPLALPLPAVGYNATGFGISEGPDPIVVGTLFNDTDYEGGRWDFSGGTPTVTGLGVAADVRYVKKAAGIMVGSDYSSVIKWDIATNAATTLGGAYDVAGLNALGTIVVARLGGGIHTELINASGTVITTMPSGNNALGINDGDMVVGFSRYAPRNGLIFFRGEFITLQADYSNGFVAVSNNRYAVASDGFDVRIFKLLLARESDDDDIPDNVDNCPRVTNPGQEDSDSDGIGNACEINVTINSVTMTPTAPVEGRAIRFQASATATGPLTYAWHFSNGPNATGKNARMSFDDQGVYSGTLTVSSATESAEYDISDFTVINAPPAIALTGDPAVEPGTSYDLGIRITDPGVNDSLNYRITWGDGTVESFVCSANPCVVTRSHTYTTAADRTVKVYAQDADGGTKTVKLPVAVHNRT